MCGSGDDCALASQFESTRESAGILFELSAPAGAQVGEDDAQGQAYHDNDGHYFDQREATPWIVMERAQILRPFRPRSPVADIGVAGFSAGCLVCAQRPEIEAMGVMGAR